jgi:hypothetical protein
MPIFSHNSQVAGTRRVEQKMADFVRRHGFHV